MDTYDLKMASSQPCVRLAHSDELDAIEEMYGQVIDVMIDTPYDILWRRGEHPSREMLEAECSTDNLFVSVSKWGRVRSAPSSLRCPERTRGLEVTRCPEASQVCDEAETSAPAGDIVGAFVLNGNQTSGYEKASWTVDVPGSEVCVVHALAVAPSARGLGMSRVLLDAAVREARLRGARSLRLDVVPYNEPGIACYRAYGMSDLGIYELTYEGFDPLPSCDLCSVFGRRGPSSCRCVTKPPLCSVFRAEGPVARHRHGLARNRSLHMDSNSRQGMLLGPCALLEARALGAALAHVSSNI